MNITYLVAGMGDRPNGGTRIIYEHANRLQWRGHRVRLFHFMNFPSDRLRGVPRRWLRYRKWMQQARPRPSWFALDPAIEVHHRFQARMPQLPRDEQIVATYWKTHDLLPDDVLAQGRCHYLIQGFETQHVAPEHLYRQWQSPSRNIAIAQWLQDKVAKVSGQAALVPNAIDYNFFNDDGSRDGANDEPPIVLFASMREPMKGSQTVIEALNLLHDQGCAFKAISFGDTEPAPAIRATWQHYQLPSQEHLRSLYRKAAIYVSASYKEGWALTLAEAGACGATLVASDIPGHREICTDGETGLLFPAGEQNAAAQAIARLLTDPLQRTRLAQATKLRLTGFTWDIAIDRLEAALLGRP